MKEKEAELIELIERAFEGVSLGKGVSLRQATGLDDYASEEELARLRELDETKDWRAISPEDLNSNYSSLSFFDAEGMRFHLPAFLCADLAGDYCHEIAFNLCRSGDLSASVFSLLNAEQKQVVREYLSLLIDRFPSGSPPEMMISGALDSFWIRDE